MNRTYVMSALCVCYLGVGTHVSAEPAKSEVIGGFIAYTQTDPITDEDRSYVKSWSEDRSSSLTWLCEGQTLRIQVSYSGLLFYSHRDEGYAVTLRFDKEKPAETRFWNTLSQSSTLLLDSDQVEAFSIHAMKSAQVVLRAVDGDRDTQTGVFSLVGLRQALMTLPCSIPQAAR